jgi:hypothetical protein
MEAVSASKAQPFTKLFILNFKTDSLFVDISLSAANLAENYLRAGCVQLL